MDVTLTFPILVIYEVDLIFYTHDEQHLNSLSFSPIATLSNELKTPIII